MEWKLKNIQNVSLMQKIIYGLPKEESRKFLFFENISTKHAFLGWYLYISCGIKISIMETNLNMEYLINCKYIYLFLKYQMLN